MSDWVPDFTDAALVGHLVSVSLLAKMVDRGVISASDAADLLDDVLLQLEEWQSPFPAHQVYFESARRYLSESLDGYRAIAKTRDN